MSHDECVIVHYVCELIYENFVIFSYYFNATCDHFLRAAECTCCDILYKILVYLRKGIIL